MANSSDDLLRQLTKNLYDYEDDDLTEKESEAVVNSAYETISNKHT